MLRRLDDSVVNNELVAALIHHIVENFPDHSDGAILVFLPGVQEINSLHNHLTDGGTGDFGGYCRDESKFKVMCLHSMLGSDEQVAVFRRCRARKVILSTNIAETSVTIPEVVFVIDSGRVKEVRYETASKMRCLVNTLVSRASAKQRWGRAGRVREGYCFTLYSRYAFEHAMQEHQVPEILRSPLEDVCLEILAVGSVKGGVQDFLKRAVTPPVAQQVTAAMALLSEVGAVSEPEQLTPLGHFLSTLPVDVRLGKILVYGAMFGISDIVIPIVATMSVKSPFLLSQEHRQKGYASPGSDHAAYYNLYTEWRQARRDSSRFCRAAGVSERTMRSIDETCTELRRHLASSCAPLFSTDGLREAQVKEALMPAALCAGLLPGVLRCDPVTRRWQSREGEASLGMNSVHAGSGDTAATRQQFLVFNEKSKTAVRVQVREATLTTMMMILLFDGKYSVNHTDGSATCGGWIRFTGKTRTLAALSAFRQKLDVCLSRSLEGRSAPQEEQAAFRSVFLTLLRRGGMA